MSFARRVRAFLHPPADPDRSPQAILGDLERRLGELEARELAHDIAWREAKDQIGRHLKRVAAIEARTGGGHSASDELTQRVLDLKLRRGAS